MQCMVRVCFVGKGRKDEVAERGSWLLFAGGELVWEIFWFGCDVQMEGLN